MWAQMDWIARLEVIGIILMLAYCALAAIDPVLADSVGNALIDFLRSL